MQRNGVDHYRTLQVTRNADATVIDRAYRALSMIHHPDRNQPAERDAATSRMRELNEAYRVLRDPQLRAVYDATLLPESASAWEQFMDRGLFGMFADRFASKRT
jgi:DnaJ-class molecular chaperone